MKFKKKVEKCLKPVSNLDWCIEIFGFKIFFVVGCWIVIALWYKVEK